MGYELVMGMMLLRESGKLFGSYDLFFVFVRYYRITIN